MIWGWNNLPFFVFAASVLLLLLLYFLRYRGKVFFTQALFLWDEDCPEEKSSSRFMLRVPPLSFFLEGAALILMVCGGASLFAAGREKFPPAVILLNDSYSMDPSARLRGRETVEKYLRKFPGRQVFWVLCGNEPELLSSTVDSSILGEKWKALESEFNAPRAIAWAKKNFPGAEICVVTDRPLQEHDPQEITLICCGRKGANAAIVNAGIREGRILLEIAGFADDPMELSLKVNGRFLEKFLLPPGEKKLLNFTHNSSADILRFTIECPADALGFDNTVTLVNVPRKPVSYSFGSVSKTERTALTQVLEKDPEFRCDEKNCELLFTGGGEKRGTFTGNRVLFHRGKRSVLDRNMPFLMPDEPLLAGLSNVSLLWAFAPDVRLPGRGLIFSSRGALLSRELLRNRKYDIHFNLSFEHSNLVSLPFWPGFFCNLAQLCRKSRPGIEESCVKVDEMIFCHLSPGAEKLRFGKGRLDRELPAPQRGVLAFSLKECGLYTLNDGFVTSFLAVNPLVTKVSDLRQNKTFILPGQTVGKQFLKKHDLTWIFAAGALLLLAVNQFLLAKRRSVL